MAQVSTEGDLSLVGWTKTMWQRICDIFSSPRARESSDTRHYHDISDGSQSTHSPPGASDGQPHLSAARPVPVLTQPHPLPGAQVQLPV